MDAETFPRVRRVLMTADTVGGVWTYALSLIRELDRAGIEVLLATMGRMMTPQQRAQAAAIPGLRVAESCYALEWMDEPWRDVAAAGNWLLELERQWQPDVIHLNGYVHAALHWTAPTLVVGHSCVLSWWQAVKGEDAGPEWDGYRRRVSRGLHATQMVVAPTHGMAADLQRIYRLRRGVRVIYNGVDTAQYFPLEKEQFLLAAGRLWDEAKNVSVLQSVAPELSWPVYLAGEAVHPNGNQARVENVHALGQLSPEALAHWYAKAAIYVAPARYEPFGLSILEAALSGCGLILGDIPTLRELWNGCALFVPPADAVALSEAAQLLSSDTGLRTRLSQRARQRAAQFTIERCANQYQELYGQLLQAAIGEPYAADLAS